MDLKFNVYGLQIEQDIVTVFGEHRIQMFQILKGKYNTDELLIISIVRYIKI